MPSGVGSFMVFWFGRRREKMLPARSAMCRFVHGVLVWAAARADAALEAATCRFVHGVLVWAA